MEQLRLLLFEDCNRGCVGCCNNQYDLSGLPVCEDYTPYSMIMLTGGEPMLRPGVVLSAIANIREQNPGALIVLYTALTRKKHCLSNVLDLVDGATITLHEESDIESFFGFYLYYLQTRKTFENKSLRLNVFFRFRKIPGWKVKDNMRWIENCPLPENEVFMRYSKEE